MLTPILNERCFHWKRKSPIALRSASAIAQRGRRRAMLEQHAELVAAEARQRVAFAQPRPQQRADLAQQLVARGVAAGVVDDLELVEVEVEHRVIACLVLAFDQHHAHAPLEFAPVEQAGQRVVAREMRKPRRVLAFAAHVVEHEHDADDAAAHDRESALPL